MTDTIILLGGGGHCKSCIDVVESTTTVIAGIVDRDANLKNVSGYPVLGNDELLSVLAEKGHAFLITIGQIGTPIFRIALYDTIKKLKGKCAIIVSNYAMMARSVSLGEGTIIMHQAMINTEAVVGKNCIINNKALIEHEAIVGDHTHVSTGAIINGGCKVGSRVFVGSNAVVVQGIEIANDVVIGAGSVVVKNLDKSGVYAGNPAKWIKP